MKSILTRNIASDIASNIIANTLAKLNVGTVGPECYCGDNCCTCAARYFGAKIIGPEEMWVVEDYYGATVGCRPVDGGVEFYGTTCGGHSHTLTILRNGQLTITHEGARRSFPGTLHEYLPAEWWEINDIRAWRVVSYETTEPSWAVVAGLLRGKLGDGPQNAEEAGEMEASQKVEALQGKFLAIGKDWPKWLGYIPGFGWADANGNSASPPAWTAIDYRRAAACGISL